MKKVVAWALLAIVILLAVLGATGALKDYGETLAQFSEMQELELEQIYVAAKPPGMGSVQALAITPEYFVVTSRPPDEAANGGENQNRLTIIDRTTMSDVTAQLKHAQATYDLGHANGMTYDPKRDELVVVGVRSTTDAHCDTAVRIRPDDFAVASSETLAGAASGIAYAGSGEYYVRTGSTIRKLNAKLQPTGERFNFSSGLDVQDIAYHGGYIYLADWGAINNISWLRRIGLQLNRNVIYRVDGWTGEVEAFAVREPRQELESLDFADGECYLLLNGVDDFRIYRVSGPLKTLMY